MYYTNQGCLLRHRTAAKQRPGQISTDRPQTRTDERQRDVSGAAIPLRKSASAAKSRRELPAADRTKDRGLQTAAVFPCGSMYPTAKAAARRTLSLVSFKAFRRPGSAST